VRWRLLLFFRRLLFCWSLFLSRHYQFTSDPYSLYDYCSPLSGKLVVKNIFKSCHIKIQSKNRGQRGFFRKPSIGYHGEFGTKERFGSYREQ